MRKDRFVKCIAEGGFTPLNNIFIKRLQLDCTYMISILMDRQAYFEKKNILDKQNGFYDLEEHRIKNSPLSTFQQRKAINILKGLGLIGTRLKGMPPKLYFYINYNLIAEFILYHHHIKRWLIRNDVVEYKSQYRPRHDEVLISQSWDSNSIKSWLDLRSFFNLDLLQIWDTINKKYGPQISHDILTSKEFKDLCTKKLNTRSVPLIIKGTCIKKLKVYIYNYTKEPMSFINKRLDSDPDGSQQSSKDLNGNNQPEDKPPKKRRKRNTTPRNHRNIPSMITNIWNACPTTTTHRLGTKTWRSIIVMLGQLIDGQFILGKHFDPGWKKTIPEEYFNGKCWSTREVKKVLEDLTLYSQEGYWPKDKRNFRHLQTLLYNPASGKSMFLSTAVKPPKPLSEERRPVKDKITANMLERLVETLEIDEHDAQRYNRPLVQTAKDLMKYYTQDLPECKQASYHFSSGEIFAECYAEFINNNWPGFQEDKIGTSSRVFDDFVIYIGENLNIC